MSSVDTSKPSHSYGPQILGKLNQNIPKLQVSPYYAAKQTSSSQKQGDSFDMSDENKENKETAISTIEDVLSPTELVQKALLKIPGIENLHVNWGKPLYTLVTTDESSEIQAVKSTGKAKPKPNHFALSGIGETALPKKVGLTTPPSDEKKRKDPPEPSKTSTQTATPKGKKAKTTPAKTQPTQSTQSSDTFKPIPFDRLYPSDLTQVTLNQYGNSTCYFLAWIDSALHHPQGRQILERIGITENDTDYKVKFPGQTKEIKVPKRLITQTTGLGVRSNYDVIRILERAYLKIPGARSGRFDESIDALNRVFEDKQKERRTKTKTTEEIMILNDRSVGRRVLLKVAFDKASGNFMTAATPGHPAQPITPADMIDSEAQGLRDKITEAQAATQPMELNLEVLDDYKNARGVQETRHKFLQPDHFIGSTGIMHEERKDKLQEYIQTALDNHRAGTALDLDILTAIRTRGGVHYYSMRVLDSTPTQITLADPGNTATAIRQVPIDTFLRDYNLTGIRLSPDP